jgi:hypothetical protein
MILNIILGIMISSVAFGVYLLFRNRYVFNGCMYWNNLIYDYNVYQINSGSKERINYTEIIDYYEYMWDIFNFNKETMIENEEVWKKLVEFESTRSLGLLK